MATKKAPRPGAREREAIRRRKELHDAAQRANVDDGLFVFRHVVDHAACDRGTALLVYWRGNPVFDEAFVDVDACPAWRRRSFTFLRKLEARLLAGDFKTALIPFDPHNDRGHDWTEGANAGAPRPIPPALFVAVEGVVDDAVAGTR